MGKQGIRLLARIVRDSVYTKLVTSCSYSSTLQGPAQGAAMQASVATFLKC